MDDDICNFTPAHRSWKTEDSDSDDVCISAFPKSSKGDKIIARKRPLVSSRDSDDSDDDVKVSSSNAKTTKREVMTVNL
jgi:hypothetical protein